MSVVRSDSASLLDRDSCHVFKYESADSLLPSRPSSHLTVSKTECHRPRTTSTGVVSTGKGQERKGRV